MKTFVFYTHGKIDLITFYNYQQVFKLLTVGKSARSQKVLKELQKMMEDTILFRQIFGNVSVVILFFTDRAIIGQNKKCKKIEF